MIRRPARALVLGLAASLFLSSLPLPAAAALGKIVPVLPANAGAGLSSAGLVRALPHTASFLTLTAPALGAANLNAASLVAGAPAAAAPPAPARAAPADAPGSRTVIVGVETAFTRIQGARENNPASFAAALDELYEGFSRQSAPHDGPRWVFHDDKDAPVLAEATATKLAPSSQKLTAPADGPRWVLTGETPAAPKTGWKRTLSIGLLAAVISLAMSGIITGAAKVLGHVQNSNFANPSVLLGDVPTLGTVLLLTVVVAVLAPIAEEIVFRAGLQGGLAKVTKFLGVGEFWIPAVLSSLLFVAVHETSDPVLFGVRMIFALALSYVFKKEGVLASMSAHAFFNGILVMQLVSVVLLGMLPASAALSLGLAAAGVLAFAMVLTKAGLFIARKLRKLYSVPLIGLGALVLLGAGLMPFVLDPATQAAFGVMLAFLSAIAYAAAKAAGYLNSRRPDIASGAVAPKAFTPLHGVVALLIVAAGYLLLMPVIVWLGAAVLLAPWLTYKLFKHLKG